MISLESVLSSESDETDSDSDEILEGCAWNIRME
jgi:hypothetical protein